MAFQSDKRFSSLGRDDLPESLRNRESPQREFSAASDPFARIEQEARAKSQVQSHGEQNQGSQMVEDDKPFPQLKPRNAHEVIEKSFNNRWKAEYRRAELTQPKTRDAFDAIEQAAQDRKMQVGHGHSPRLAQSR